MRSSLLFVVLASVAFASVACTEEPPTKLDREGSEDRFEKTEDTDKTEPTKQTDTPAPAAQQKPPATNTKPPAQATTCGGKATKKECGVCCGVQENPLKQCGCTGECADACGDNFCSDKMPSFACGICLAQNAQENCTIDGAGAGNAAKACLEQCASLPNDAEGEE